MSMVLLKRGRTEKAVAQLRTLQQQRRSAERGVETGRSKPKPNIAKHPEGSGSLLSDCSLPEGKVGMGGLGAARAGKEESKKCLAE